MQKSLANIFALRFKIQRPNVVRSLLLMTYIVWLNFVTMATSDDVRFNYLLFWWRPSWIHHLGFSNSHFSKAKQWIL